MQQDIYERAKSALHDYIIYLRDRGDNSDSYRCHGHTKKENKYEVRYSFKRTYRKSMDGDLRRDSPEIHSWLNRKELEWRIKDRLTADNYLKIGSEERPWTIERISKTWWHLNIWDKLAILIIVDGKITEEEMESMKDNIRAVVEEIVEMKMAQMFSSTLLDMRRGVNPDDSLTPLNYRVTSKTASKRRKQIDDFNNT